MQDVDRAMDKPKRFTHRDKTRRFSSLDAASSSGFAVRLNLPSTGLYCNLGHQHELLCSTCIYYRSLMKHPLLGSLAFARHKQALTIVVPSSVLAQNL
jgi:hypothetical protein